MTATAAVSAKAPVATVSRLARVQRGRLASPLRYVFYGAEGVGKSTLAASAPDPIWFDCEDGSGRLNVARYMFHDGDGGHVPQSYADILAAIDDLTASPHNFQTLVIDTADRLESMIWGWMLARDSKVGKPLDSIEAYGYGKGYQRAVDEWRALCLRFDRLRMSRRMSIILLAHAQIRPFKNPEGDDYDRYFLRVNDKAAGFLKEWADVTGFCCFDEFGAKMGEERARGASTGKRLLKLERTAAFDAKSRIALPREVELDASNPWAPLATAVENGMAMTSAQIVEQITAELARLSDPALEEKVKGVIATALPKDDTATLNRALLKLRDIKSAAA